MMPKDDDYSVPVNTATVTRLEAEVAALRKRLATFKGIYPHLDIEVNLDDKCSEADRTPPQALAEALEMTEEEFKAVQDDSEKTAVAPLGWVKCPGCDGYVPKADLDRHLLERHNIGGEIPPLSPCPNEKCRHSNTVKLVSRVYVRYGCLCGTSGPWAEDESAARALWNGVAKKVSIGQRLIGPKDHPEHWCHLCGGRNVKSWYADNDTWNEIVRTTELNIPGEIICPICLSELAEKHDGDFVTWHFHKANDEPEIDKLRVTIFDLRVQVSELTKQSAKDRALAERVRGIYNCGMWLALRYYVKNDLNIVDYKTEAELMGEKDV